MFMLSLSVTVGHKLVIVTLVWSISQVPSRPFLHIILTSKCPAYNAVLHISCSIPDDTRYLFYLMQEKQVFNSKGVPNVRFNLISFANRYGCPYFP